MLRSEGAQGADAMIKTGYGLMSPSALLETPNAPPVDPAT